MATVSLATEVVVTERKENIKPVFVETRKKAKQASLSNMQACDKLKYNIAEYVANVYEVVGELSCLRKDQALS